MQIVPLSSRVLVRPVGSEETTKSGIVIPVTIEKEKPEQGEVVAVGEGRRNDKGELVPMSVKVGDRVVFKKYSPDEVKVEGKEYLILDEGDILAVLK